MDDKTLSQRAGDMARDNVSRMTDFSRSPVARVACQLPEAVVRKTREYLMRRRLAYHQVFTGVYADVVLADLATFCRAQSSTHHTDPRVSALLEGRREVWLRIQEHLQLSEAELWALRRPDLKAGIVSQQEEDDHG